MKNKKILVAAGGTGGHLFPALAVVEQLKNILGNKIDFAFFGRKDKIEGRIVPELNYKLHETNLQGLVNKKSFNTAKLPFQILAETIFTYNLIKRNNFDAVICAGAYLSIPPGIAASLTKRKLILLESNVNPGKAIGFLANRADAIFTSFEETQTFFKPQITNKIQCLGNPVRNSILNSKTKTEARNELNLDIEKPVILIFGGSLGAKSINDAVIQHLSEFENSGWQVIWQTGNSYNAGSAVIPKNIKAVNFIHNMDVVYSAADLIVSRSGATTVAELCVLGKPSILIPLPSASNNEQYYNAKVLETNGASILLKNEEIGEKIYQQIVELIKNEKKLAQMQQAALKLAKPNAGEEIAKGIINICSFF